MNRWLTCICVLALISQGAVPAPERDRAMSSGLLGKWRYLLAERTKLERDQDWTGGFLRSRELRDCRCTRPNPEELVHRIETKDGIAALELDDERNTRCEVCLLDSFPRWKARSQKQCGLALELTEFELSVLMRSDDGNGLPLRCIEPAVVAARQRLADAAPKVRIEIVHANKEEEVVKASTSIPSIEKQLRLNEGMPMSEVSKLLGVPDQTESLTCGAKTKTPWPCRTWTWRRELERHEIFTVTFQTSKGVWVVNGWQ